MGAASSPLQCRRRFLLPRNSGNHRLKQAARRKQALSIPVLTLGAEHAAKDRPFATMRSSATLQAGTDLLGPASGLVAAPDHGSMDPTSLGRSASELGSIAKRI